MQNAAQLPQTRLVQHCHGAVCAAVIPCSEALIAAADLGLCSGIVLGHDRITPTTLLPSRAVLSSAAAWDRAEGLSKLRHSGPLEAAVILCFLCWGCCIHLLTQVTSPKHPQAAQQFFRTIPAMEGKGRKGKDLSFSGSLSSSSEVTETCGMPSYSHADGECKFVPSGTVLSMHVEDVALPQGNSCTAVGAGTEVCVQ